MRKVLRILKNIWVINLLRRLYLASGYFNHRYPQILKWGFSSNEDTNFTYDLTADSIKYLVHTIAMVTRKDYDEIQRYVREIQTDQELRATMLAAIQGSSEKKFADKELRFGRRMGWYAFARAMKPGVIIETGVDKGMGSMVLCAALVKNREEGYEGRYYGTDINPRAGYMLQGKYREVGEILYGDSIQSLSKFAGQIDLFINDSDHSEVYEHNEYETIRTKIAPGSVILSDNAHCNSQLADFSLQLGRKFIYFHEFPLNHWYPGAGIGISFE